MMSYYSGLRNNKFKGKKDKDEDTERPLLHWFAPRFSCWPYTSRLPAEKRKKNLKGQGQCLTFVWRGGAIYKFGTTTHAMVFM